MRGGMVSVSWGKWGGFYYTGYKSTRLGFFPYMRLCLGFVAVTYIGADLDEILSMAAGDGGES
jgi:hypothetical protein